MGRRAGAGRQGAGEGGAGDGEAGGREILSEADLCGNNLVLMVCSCVLNVHPGVRIHSTRAHGVAMCGGCL